LRAKRLELTRASLRERLLAGDLDDVRAVVQSLTEEFDVLDVAAAAVKLAQATIERPDDIATLPDVDLPSSRRPRSRRGPSGDGAREASGSARLFVGAGRQAGIRPSDLVGAITNEARVSGSQLGAIDIRDRFSLPGASPEVERAKRETAALLRAAGGIE
jgi:ATP-dependent RNA helicase DeaD